MTRWINGYADEDGAGRRTLQEAAASRIGHDGKTARRAQGPGSSFGAGVPRDRGAAAR